MKIYSLNRPLPANLSVQDALKSYLNENGFATEEYDLDSVKVTFGDGLFRLRIHPHVNWLFVSMIFIMW